MIKDRKIGSDRKQDSIPKFVLACKVAVFQADVESSVVCCTTLALYQAWSVPLLLSLPAASLCFSALYFPRCTSLYFHSSECFQIEMWFTWSITSKVCIVILLVYYPPSCFLLNITTKWEIWKKILTLDLAMKTPKHSNSKILSEIAIRYCKTGVGDR